MTTQRAAAATQDTRNSRCAFGAQDVSPHIVTLKNIMELPGTHVVGRGKGRLAGWLLSHNTHTVGLRKKKGSPSTQQSQAECSSRTIISLASSCDSFVSGEWLSLRVTYVVEAK